MASCTSSALKSLSPASRSTWSSDPGRPPKDGAPSCVTIHRTSRPWTYSLPRPLASTCSMPLSSCNWFGAKRTFNERRLPNWIYEYAPLTVSSGDNSPCSQSANERRLRRACPATRAGREAGTAEQFAAAPAGSLPSGVGQVQLVVANEADPIAAEARLAERRLGRFCQRMPVEPHRALALAAADQYIEALHRQVKVQCLHPFDGDAQSVIVAQVVELGAIFALDRLDPQRLATSVGLGALSLGTVERRKALERYAAHVVVIGVHAVAVALKPAAHDAQKRLHTIAQLLIEQRSQPRFERNCAPSGPRREPDCRIGRLPVVRSRQCRTQACQDVADDRAGAEVEAEPHQSLAFLVGHRGVPERQQQAARPGRGHALETPDRVWQIDRKIEHPLGVAWRWDCGRRPHLAFAPASLLSKQRAEAVEPVALESDRNRLLAALSSEAEARQLGPAGLLLQGRGHKHLEFVGVHGRGSCALALQQRGDEIAQLGHRARLMRPRSLRRTGIRRVPWRPHAAAWPHAGDDRGRRTPCCGALRSRAAKHRA